MSAGSKRIVCRRCNKVITIDEENCPHCGTSIRGNIVYFAVIAVGVLLVGTTLLNPSQLLLFGVIGVLLIAGSGYMYYDKRRRMQEAIERSSETES